MFLAPVGLALRPPYRGPWDPPHLELSSRAASSSSLSKGARTRPACPVALQTPAEWCSPPQSWPSPLQATHQRAEPQARSNTARTCLGRTRGCQGAPMPERRSGGGAGQHGRAVWEPQADLPVCLWEAVYWARPAGGAGWDNHVAHLPCDAHGSVPLGLDSPGGLVPLVAREMGGVKEPGCTP